LDSFLARICPQEGYKHTVVTPLKIWDSNPRTAWKAVVWKAHVGNKPSDIENNKDILWPERFDREWFTDNYKDKLQLGHPELYAQEMLNKPLDEATAFFRKHDFLPITEDDKQALDNGKMPLVYYVGVDLAISEKERADYSVFQVVGVDDKGMMYHIDRVKERIDGRDIIETFFALQTRWNPEFFAVEDEKISKSLGPFLIEEMMKRNKILNLIPLRPSTDKPTRAKPLQAKMRIGGVKFRRDAEYFADLQSEFLAFPRGKHDDQVDAFAYIAMALESVQAAPTFAELEEDEWAEEEYNSKQTGLGYGRSRITGY
jgi:predicted phage terminase large subunit-like protein